MSPVVELLRQAAQAPPGTPALDAVMGADWAALRLGTPRRAPQIAVLVREAVERDVRRGRATSVDVAAGSPQAVVKFIAKGGAKDERGLRTQMAYLSRDGETPLVRSESYLGAAVTVDALAEAWHLPGENDGADRTSHFLVSFPHGTNPLAAERAGRAWADEVFGSGRFGDTWDYYTAFHTDRAHPHLHVVVNRRGEEEGAWLKVSRRGELTFDVLREIQVEVAAREGIELDATPRLARGQHDRPIPDREIRAAAETGRAPIAPEHTSLTAARNAATVLHYARRYAADAALIEAEAPGFARAMQQAAVALAHGQAALGAGGLAQGEVRRMSETIQDLRAGLEAKFARIDAELAGLPHSAERIRFERGAALLKSEAAGLLPDRADLQRFLREDPQDRYDGGIVAETAREREIAAAASARVRDLAQAAGLDPVIALERHAGGRVAEAVAASWARAELAERAQSREEQGLDGETPQEARAVLAAFHGSVAAITIEARSRIADVERDRAELDALVRAPEGIRLGDGPDGGDLPDSRQRFLSAVRNVLTKDQVAVLERGEPEALAEIRGDPAEQARLAGAYLEAARRGAPAAERARFEAALQALDARGTNARGLDHGRDDGHEL